MGMAWLNLGSLVLGLIAWILPVVNVMRRKEGRRGAALSCLSLAACALSLSLQIFYTEHLVNKGDWSALMDTTHAVSVVATTLLVVTLALNALSWVLGAPRARHN